MKIGFIGLGNMGLPMAKNLLQEGYDVIGYDVLFDKLNAFQEAGGKITTDLTTVSEDAEIIITMLQTGKQVQAVCLGETGILNIAKHVNLYIDCSSIDVKTARIVHNYAKQQQILMVDAPVSGGVVGAIKRNLTFMVGGSSRGYEAAKRILQHLGKNIIHTGDDGSGQAAKICNNMILGISMIAISEAFILGEKLDLEPKKLYEVVTKSSGQCWAMSHYVPVPDILDSVPANEDYRPGFSAAMMLKDLNLSQESAEAVNFKTHLAEVATKIYQKFNQHHSDLDFSAIIKLIEKS